MGSQSHLIINSRLSLPMSEIEMVAIRASGPGGQNVNKVSSAIHLRFDVQASSLPNPVKAKILTLTDSRLTKGGVIVIKANEHRTQSANKQAAARRLAQMLREVLTVQKRRIPTKIGRGALKRRRDAKTNRAGIKANRRKPSV